MERSSQEKEKSRQSRTALTSHVLVRVRDMLLQETQQETCRLVDVDRVVAEPLEMNEGDQAHATGVVSRLRQGYMSSLVSGPEVVETYAATALDYEVKIRDTCFT